MSHKLFRAAAVAVLALLVTSCASAVTGSPQAAPGAITAETATKSTSKSTPKSGTTTTKKGTPSTPNTSIANATGPCKFISPEMAQKLSLKNPVEDRKEGYLPACVWDYGTAGGGVYVGLIDNRFDDLESKNETILIDTKINDRRAKGLKAPNGQKNACALILEYTENELLNITGVLDIKSTDTDAACQWITDVATLIEPGIN